MLIKTNDQGVVVNAYVGAYPADKAGYIETADTNTPFFDDFGVPICKWNGTRVIPRTASEIQADHVALPPPPPSDSERITALEQENKQLKETINSLTLGVNQAR